MTLLTGGKRGASFGNGCNEGFVISEQGEKMAFKEEAEVADGEVGCQQFSVESGEAGFSGGKFM